MKTVIIGAGAAGLMAAANIPGALVLERNEKAGKKLYITGKGRCNLTNDCPPDEFLKEVTGGARFLQSAINRFPPSVAMSFFETKGLPLKTERGRRVFPLSDKASDVTKILVKAAEGGGVEFVFGANINGIRPQGAGFDIYYEKEGGKHKIHADTVVVACGGKSYPATGSDGSIYTILKALGHTVTELKPALVSFVFENDVSALKGISFKYVRAIAICKCENSPKSVTVSEAAGELLFTDKGVSGPAILTLSALSARQHVESVILDFKPSDSESDLDTKLISLLKEDGARAVKNTLAQLLPKSLAWYIIDYTGINLDKKSADITKNERTAIVGAIKGLKFGFKHTAGFDEAVITSGGVSLKEIDPKSMQSKLHKNLYIIGETLDIDALTGGYNLQLAWSTAFVAAESINKVM